MILLGNKPCCLLCCFWIFLETNSTKFSRRQPICFIAAKYCRFVCLCKGKPVIVSTNLSALSSQRTLFENTKAASISMERLATGSKINKAQDDVAGSAIADRMTSQVRGLNCLQETLKMRLSRSVAETMYADQTSSCKEYVSLLFRLPMIATLEKTVSTCNRRFLLVAEMDKIASQTMFNGESIGGWKNLQLGADAGQSIETHITTLSGHSGTTYGTATQDYAAGSTNL